MTAAVSRMTIRKGVIQMISTISTNKAPAAIGPYSQAYRVENLLITSGQMPIVPETGAFSGTDICTQAEQTIRNLEQVLLVGGSSLKHVVKTTCFLADMEDFAAFNSVYEKYFISKPARSCVAVKTLPKNALVEIEAIAAI